MPFWCPHKHGFCRNCRRLPGDTYSRWSLRFYDEGTEQGFARSQTSVLVNNTFQFAMSVFLLFTFNMVRKISSGGHLDYTLSTPERHIKFVSTCFDLVLGVLSGGTMILARVWKHGWRVKHFSCEIYLLLVTSCGIIVGFASISYYTAGLIGAPRDALAHMQHSDAWPLLLIDFVTTVTHLFLPVRWFTLVPLQIVGPVLYAGFAFGLGSPHPNHVPFNLLTLTALTLCASLGKRSTEKYQRVAFLSLIAEKSARCESEFKLSQIEEERGVPQVRRLHGDCATTTSESSLSAPTTTDSGRIFEIRGLENPRQKLEEIAEKGREEHWLISEEHVRFFPQDRLGVGGFGVVIHGMLRGTPVACKVSRSQGLSNGRMPYLMNELRILRLLRHPNLVSFYGACIDFQSAEVALIFELLEGVTLATFVGIEQVRLPTLAERCHIIVQIGGALRYLHEQSPSIVHSDLKPENIMIDYVNSGIRVKVFDFGLSSVSTRRAKTKGGTTTWQAPELIRRPKDFPRTSADVFSFGLVMAFTLTGCIPKRTWHGEVSMHGIQFDASLTTIQGLVDKCCSLDPLLRESAKHVQCQVSAAVEVLLNNARSTSTTASSGLRWKDALQEVRAYEVERLRSKDKNKGIPDCKPKFIGKQLLKPNLRSVPEGNEAPHDESQLRLPGFKLTPVDTQQIVLFEALSRLNCVVDLRSYCCDFHAVIASANTICRGLQAAQCRQVPDFGSMQCANCGVLESTDSVSKTDLAIDFCELCTKGSALNSRGSSTTIESFESITRGVYL